MDIRPEPDPSDPGEIFYTPDSDLPSPNSCFRKRHSINQNSGSLKMTIIDPSAAIPSIQTIHVNPSLNDLLNFYHDSDSGPYIVHVSRLETEPLAGLSIKALKFGEFLFKNKIQNINKEEVKIIGRNKISIEFLSADAANNFMLSPLLTSHKYKAFVPTFSITHMGLVRDVPIEWSMQAFTESLELPSGCGPILKARRLNRKQVVDGVTSWVPTQS